MIQNNFSNYNLCKFSWNIILLEKNIAFESENIFEIKFWLKNNEKWIFCIFLTKFW